ncbi:MAG: helix-turn-helix transcriptional regulator [Bacteroidales bacterium]|nr:helix-turn-helix transcriptional regulator [Bacteroidales bacterium]
MIYILTLSLLLNAVLLILFVHGRMSYHLIMTKNLKKEDLKDELVDKVSFDTLPPTDEPDQTVLNNLQAALETDMVYLDPDLNMQKLAKIVGTNKVTLSHVINDSLQQNFATLLNKYRIREAIRLLSDPKLRNHKIEAIGEMCGYSNRQVFHAAFKKEMGITPTHFRNISKKNISA